MNTFKLLMVLIITCVAFETFAQTREESSTSAQQATTATKATVQSATARKPQRAGKSHASQSASGTISAPPGVVANLCCGSVDNQNMTGNNCSYLGPGGGCAGFILACPNGTTNKVDAEENGYCKPD